MESRRGRGRLRKREGEDGWVFFKKQTVRKVEGIKNKAGQCFVLK